VSLAGQIIEHGPYKPGERNPVAYGVDCDALNQLRDELIAGRRRGTRYEEWRVTGKPRLRTIEQKYSGEDYTDPEQAARIYLSNAVIGSGWTDGPHLHKRTVTVSKWTEVDA
jgi:hypothetical protein